MANCSLTSRFPSGDKTITMSLLQAIIMLQLGLTTQQRPETPSKKLSNQEEQVHHQDRVPHKAVQLSTGVSSQNSYDF